MFQNRNFEPFHDSVEGGHARESQPEEVVDAADEIAAENSDRDEQDVHVELLQENGVMRLIFSRQIYPFNHL